MKTYRLPYEVTPRRSPGLRHPVGVKPLGGENYHVSIQEFLDDTYVQAAAMNETWAWLRTQGRDET